MIKCFARSRWFNQIAIWRLSRRYCASYLPWATEAAHHLQKVVANDGYPGKMITNAEVVETDAGTCYLFIDGLRLDLAKRLLVLLEDKAVKVHSSVSWTALPSVTSTAKPAVTPVRHLIKGADINNDFTPDVAATGKSLKGGYQLQKLLEDEGWQKLGKAEMGDPTGRAWCEIGDIDHEGHERGWKLARHVDSLLGEAVERAEQLLAAGWKEIRILTDHGWLLLPGGLPTTSLAPSLSENKWGRCAALSPARPVRNSCSLGFGIQHKASLSLKEYRVIAMGFNTRMVGSACKSALP